MAGALRTPGVVVAGTPALRTPGWWWRDAGAEDAGAASSAHASAKPQLRNQARPLKHANSSGFGDVDHDPVGGRWIQEKRNDAVLACRSAR